MTEPVQTQITLSLTHIQHENLPALMYLVEQERLGDLVAAQILSLLPDPQTWRLTITGDMVKAVNEIEARDDENTYTSRAFDEASDGETDPVSGPAFELGLRALVAGVRPL